VTRGLSRKHGFNARRDYARARAVAWIRVSDLERAGRQTTHIQPGWSNPYRFRPPFPTPSHAEYWTIVERREEYIRRERLCSGRGQARRFRSAVTLRPLFPILSARWRLNTFRRVSITRPVTATSGFFLLSARVRKSRSGCATGVVTSARSRGTRPRRRKTDERQKTLADETSETIPRNARSIDVVEFAAKSRPVL